MALVVGTTKLVTISKAVREGGLLTVGGTVVKVASGTISRAGCKGVRVKWLRWVGR
jgi:hypothetical protein